MHTIVEKWVYIIIAQTDCREFIQDYAERNYTRDAQKKFLADGGTTNSE